MGKFQSPSKSGKKDEGIVFHEHEKVIDPKSNDLIYDTFFLDIKITKYLSCCTTLSDKIESDLHYDKLEAKRLKAI